MNNSLKDMKWGLIFALATLCFGFFMGAYFGAKEEDIKAKLKADATAVMESVYQNDQAKFDKAIDKAWTYIKRGHFHGTGIATSALMLIVLLSLVNAAKRAKQIAALFLGLGGLVYSICWSWAGFLIPSLGSSGAAKEQLALLAKPSAMLTVLGLLLAVVLIVKDLFSSPVEG